MDFSIWLACVISFAGGLAIGVFMGLHARIGRHSPRVGDRRRDAGPGFPPEG